MTDREGIAYHEAGHAAMAALLDIPFGQVTINADTDSAGHVVLKAPYAYVYGEDVGPDDQDTRTGRLIVFWLAGRAAERFYLGDAFNEETSKADIAQAYAVSAYASSSPEDTEQFLNECEGQAYEAVENYWDVICEVADALLARTTLSETEVKQIITDFYAPLEELIQQQRSQRA